MSDETRGMLLSALGEARELTEWLQVRTSGKVQLDARTGLAAAYFALSIDHRGAITTLIDPFRSSAAALTRSSYEAYLSGCWAYGAATNEQIERAFAGVVPKTDNMVKDLRKTHKAFGVSKQQVWETFCDFSHGGNRQISRWIGDGEIGPRHSDAEMIGWLWTADTFSVLAAMGLGRIADRPIEPFQNKLDELNNVFLKRKERLRAIGDWSASDAVFRP